MSAAASRMLERYTRNPASPETVQSSVVKLKRKSPAEAGIAGDLNVKKARVIRFESPTRPAAVSKDSASGKQTVFSRLGNSEAARAPSPKPAAKQIHSRLGSKGDGRPPRWDLPVRKDALKYEGILKGSPPEKRVSTLTKKVFTVTTSKNNERKIAVATMRADETPVSVKDKLALPKGKSVKFSNRVQYKEIEAIQRVATPVKPPPVPEKYTMVFNKPERRLSMPEAENVGVKARLGIKATKNFTITRNVFNRLGA